MAAPIGPGDWVECVDGDARYPQMPRGSIWCVEAIIPWRAFCALCEGGSTLFPALKLAGDPDDDWCACAYRPIYRPRASFIESLKAPPQRAPRETEDA